MANRCEWCGARGGTGRTFEAAWRSHHFAGPATMETWHVCNEQCEARLREHLDAAERLGFDSLARFLLWLLRAHVLYVGVPGLVAWGIAALAGARPDLAARIGVAVGCLAFGIAYIVWFYPVPIWANVRKPSSAIIKIHLRSAERLCRLGVVLVLLVMVASGVIILLLPK